MKIKFLKLDIKQDSLQVSFDGGKTFKYYKVEDIKTNNGIDFTEDDCDDLSKIVIKGRVKHLSNMQSEVSELDTATSSVISYIDDSKSTYTTTFSSNYINDRFSSKAEIHNDTGSQSISTLKDVNQIKGNTTVEGDLSINGNIYQNGDAYIVHAEDINVNNSNIAVRANATTAMTPEDHAGIVVKKYDGTNDMNLLVDSEGVARLGKMDSLQPIALRNEESEMKDGALLSWDAANKRINTTSNINELLNSAKVLRVTSWDGSTLCLSDSI